jgi:hypothetical protein
MSLCVAVWGFKNYSQGHFLVCVRVCVCVENRVRVKHFPLSTSPSIGPFLASYPIHHRYHIVVLEVNRVE